MLKKMINQRNIDKKVFWLIIPFLFVMLCCFTTAYSSENNSKETSEIKNNVFNRYESEIGRVDEKGIIYNTYGDILGSVNKEGVIFNVSDIEIGKVEPDGSVLNQSETRLGSVNDKGEIFNVSDIKIGSVKDVSDIKLIGGVARLIFFGKR